MRKKTLPAFHRCQQNAIMTSILYDLDSKKQIRYIADLLFHLCNISPSKLYTDVIFCERKEWIGIEERSSA